MAACNEGFVNGTNTNGKNTSSAYSYIASCDVGTTTLKCIIYKVCPTEVKICGSAFERTQMLIPQPGYSELEPEGFWESFLNIIKKGIADAGLSASDISCMGICSQTSTFIIWDRETGKPLHNIVAWNDRRAEELVKRYNKSFKVRFSHVICAVMYFITRIDRFHSGSKLCFQSYHATARLKHILINNEEPKEAYRKGKLMFGTVDSWLVYRLTGGKVYGMDHSNASATAMYDPHTEAWCREIIGFILNLSKKIFPKITNTSGRHWGATLPDIFGSSIPITAIMQDQTAAVIGSGSYTKGDCEINLGTAAIINQNTGKKIQFIGKSTFPLVAWKDNVGTTFVTETGVANNAVLVEWAKKKGIFNIEEDVSTIAYSVKELDNIFFIPIVQTEDIPANYQKAFVGLTQNTKRDQLIRAILETIAFRVCEIYENLTSEMSEENFKLCCMRHIRIGGGISNITFIVQTISTLLDRCIERPENVQLSSMGICLQAGLGIGIWDDYSEFSKIFKNVSVFQPIQNERPYFLARFNQYKEITGELLEIFNIRAIDKVKRK